MKARLVLPISAGLLLFAGALAWQAGPALRGGQHSALRGASAASPTAAPAAVKIGPKTAEDGLSNGGGGGKASGAVFLAFAFDLDEARIRASDREKVTRAAAYVAANPSSRIGLDGRNDPNGNGLRNQSLMERRITAVHDALIQAGVPREQIETGEFADPQERRDREVAAVIITAPKNR